MDTMKEVSFYTYCPTCKYYPKQENKEPCDECLSVGARKDTHKPLKWEDKDD